MPQELVNPLCATALIREILHDRPELSTVQIFPGVVPEATLPYIVLRRTSGEPQSVKSAASIYDIDVIALVCAETYDESLAIASAVIQELDGLRGATSDSGHTGRNFRVTLGEELQVSDASVQELFIKLTM